MKSNIAGRFAPLAAVLIVQLLIIVVAPSKSPSGQAVAAGGGTGDFSSDFSDNFDTSGVPGGFEGDSGVGDGSGIDFGSGNAASGASGGGNSATGGNSGSSGNTGGGGTTGGTPAAGTPAGGGTAAAGGTDTSHCVSGRQYDPKIYFWAPPCVPKSNGQNPGASYSGVTGDTVKIVWYIGAPHPAVQAILESQGSAPSQAQQTEFSKGIADFINQNYELYGRTVDIKMFFGECTTIPPDNKCLRNEMKSMVGKEKPFGVVWNTSLSSASFDQLSKEGVINLGGWNFRDSFNQQRRPFHWDVQMGGTQQVEHVADWWCKRMHDGKAIHAAPAGIGGGVPGSGMNAPNNDIQAKTRVLGVISTDDPENKNSVDILDGLLASKCGAKITNTYFYSQDINTAQQQRSAAVAKMREAPEATSIMCFCDLVAPIFLYQTAEEQGWYPEHVIVGSGFMDTDGASQSYDHTLQPEGKQFENAFGLRQSTKRYLTVTDGTANNNGSRVWRASGRSGNAPYTSASSDWDYFALMAQLIQMAGPNLNPGTVEQGAFRTPPRGTPAEINGDPHFAQRGFKPGDYTWTDDLAETYWSTKTVSEYNGEPGSYVQLGNRRYLPGQYPTGQLQLPAKPR